MRWSQMHIPTLREDPADAGAPSHRLLIRAGYIRQLTAGHYSLLPLATRVRQRIIEVIREEMERIGVQEFVLPALHPAEIWRRTGRWEIMGDEMFRLKDRRGADFCLGMTHEEIFTTLAGELSSHKSLPQMWYQFQTKFRDEPRPKAGLMRTREFTMKDSYSFDLTPEGLDRSFRLHHDAYVRIFERLGIRAIPVDASNGTMGGSGSTEFMSPSPVGEDFVAHCAKCGYAANTEKATSGRSAGANGPAAAAPEQFATPGIRTIEDLANRFGVPGDEQIKTLVYMLDEQLTIVLMQGSDALNEQKLIDATGAAALRPAHPDEIKAALGASPGSLGAVGVTGVPIIADELLRGREGLVTGANVDGAHLRGVAVDRDISVGSWADLREVAEGEPCSRCGSALKVEKAIEVGHIFKLGRRFTEALDVTVLDGEGKRASVIMGSYGIGVERAMAAIVETHHDDRGIVWPAAVAPFEACVVVAQADPAVTEAAEAIYEELRAANVRVIIDDRTERLGVKLSDVELVGVPQRVTVGKRGLAEGVAEVTSRITGETEKVSLSEVAGRVRAAL
ncbi:proline--tRNA ligase [Actinoplanes regularis]|uniref:Proline--tRNA ligase n=1 Tax=Actinoplanes regularis TaxID=52697 RepID=A0A238XHD7_9ACTN|nr:proline--tRNA ligase [Actinoplanes regularis]GIE86814.1 proline--tRNA ligase [Actinoplanes regularis]SNR58100.1 prolyl-tRNA synthetase [Actinoplanes regularis]